MTADRRRTLFNALTLVLVLGLMLPVVLAPTPTPVGWDDAYYFHRSACLVNAVFRPSALEPMAALADCLAQHHKSPLMAVFGLPWGERMASFGGLGLASVALAVTVWAVTIGLAELLLRAAVPRLAILLGFGVILAHSVPRAVAGGYQGDILVSLLVAAMMPLTALELRRPAPGWAASLGRGALWGLLAAAAVMTKIAAGAFVAALAPLLILVRWRRAGWAAALLATLAALVVIAPAVLYHWHFWDLLVGHALRSTSGPLAKATSYDLNFIGYLGVLAGRSGWAFAPLALLAAWAVRALSRLERGERLALLWPVVVQLGYLVAIAAGDNHDLRYALPLVFGLPMALAACTLVPPAAAEPAEARPGLRRALALLVAALISVPMVLRPDLRYVRIVQDALLALPGGQPLHVTLAADDSAINIETFQLARQLAPERLGALTIDTVVYDPLLGRSLEDSLKQIDAADLVVLIKIPIRKAPAYTNAQTESIRRHLEAAGAESSVDGSGLLEFFRRPHHP